MVRWLVAAVMAGPDGMIFPPAHTITILVSITRVFEGAPYLGSWCLGSLGVVRSWAPWVCLVSFWKTGTSRARVTEVKEWRNWWSRTDLPILSVGSRVSTHRPTANHRTPTDLWYHRCGNQNFPFGEQGNSYTILRQIAKLRYLF